MRLYLFLGLSCLYLTVGAEEAVKEAGYEYQADDGAVKELPNSAINTEEIKKELEESHYAEGTVPQPLADEDYAKPNVIQQVHQDEEYDDDDDEEEEEDDEYDEENDAYPQYPMRYPPVNLWYPPRHPQYPGPTNRYLKAIGSKKRKRREAELMKAFTVEDPEQFWYDIDGGVPNEVTETQMEDPGYATYKYIIKQKSLYGTPKHIGMISRGKLRNPHLEVASERTFGQGFDYRDEDLEFFRFRPTGERLGDYHQAYEYIKKGKLPVGRQFILDTSFITSYSECWVGKNLRTYELVCDAVDEFSTEARNLYWYKVSCSDIPLPETYTVLGLKYSLDGSSTDITHEDNHAVAFFQRPDGTFAVSNPNTMGMREWSPVLRKTALRQMYDYDEGGVAAYKVKFRQPWMVHSLNSGSTRTGVKVGNPDLYTQHHAPMYDQSAYWLDNTGTNYENYNRKLTSKYGNTVGYTTNPVFPHLPKHDLH